MFNAFKSLINKWFTNPVKNAYAYVTSFFTSKKADVTETVTSKDEAVELPDTAKENSYLLHEDYNCLDTIRVNREKGNGAVESDEAFVESCAKLPQHTQMLT